MHHSFYFLRKDTRYINDTCYEVAFNNLHVSNIKFDDFDLKFVQGKQFSTENICLMVISKFLFYQIQLMMFKWPYRSLIQLPFDGWLSHGQSCHISYCYIVMRLQVYSMHAIATILNDLDPNVMQNLSCLNFENGCLLLKVPCSVFSETILLGLSVTSPSLVVLSRNRLDFLHQ